MRRNFDLTTGLVGIGAVAVLISLFLDWYQPGLTAWHVFELTDWLLAALAVGALVLLLTETLSSDSSSQKLAWICGIVAFVVIAQLIDPPPAASGNDRAAGAWVALAGSVAMVAGAVLALAQISVTIDVAERRRRTAAVDARDAGAGAGTSPSAGEPAADASPSRSRSGVLDTSGLWKRPGGPGDAGGAGAGDVGGAGGSARGAADAGDSGPSVGGTARPAEPDAPAPAAEAPTTIVPDAPEVDDDRTQPFRAADRPDEPA
jgi:hypothetical protein